MKAELSRMVPVNRLPSQFTVEGNPAECVALAARLLIPEVRRVVCRFELRRQGETIEADGVLEAEVVQSCVVSLDPVEQSVAERFTLRFVPEGDVTDDDDPEAPDEIPYRGSSIDLGEATAEQLALALDPYPRREDAELDPSATASEQTTFSGLAALRPKT